MARAQTRPRAKAPIALARRSDLQPAAGQGPARAGLARAYCHSSAGLSRVRWWRQAVPIPVEAFGLAGEEAAAGLEEAYRGVVHPSALPRGESGAVCRSASREGGGILDRTDRAGMIEVALMPA